MISRGLIPYLRIAHGSLNIVIVFLFFYQGWLGLQIRRHRKRGGPPIFKPVRRHRKFGPIWVVFGLLGYFTGWALVYSDHGHLLQFPAHAFTGTAIAVSICTTFLISQRIKPSMPATPRTMNTIPVPDGSDVNPYMIRIKARL